MQALLVCLGLGAGLLTTLAGQGGGLLLLLACGSMFGPHVALAVTSPALLLGNTHRSFIYRRTIDSDVASPMIAGAFPGAALGGFAAGALPAWVLAAVLVTMTAATLAKAAGWLRFSVPRQALGPAAFVVGALTGIAGGAGVLFSTILLSLAPRPLTGRAFVGTSSAVAVATHLGRLVAYGGAGLLVPSLLAPSATLAVAIFVGNAAGDRLRGRVSPRTTIRLEYGSLAACAALSVALLALHG